MVNEDKLSNEQGKLESISWEELRTWNSFR